MRDTTFDEDCCTIFRGHAAKNLAVFRNVVFNWLRQACAVNLAATIRSFTWQSQRLFSKLGFMK